MENWKPVIGWLRYRVSDLGNVWSTTSSRLLSGKLDRGYKCVHLCNGDRKAWVRIHTLVAKAFVDGKTVAKWSVNHKNGIKSDNAATNLEWSSSDEQQEHAYRTGLKPLGELVSTAKLTSEQVLILFDRARAGASQALLAIEYGISQPQVSAIKTGRSWSHVTGAHLRSVPNSGRGADPTTTPDERWHSIAGYANYLVSDKGRVWSRRSGKFLKTSRANHGKYVAVNLCLPSGARKHLVHRLVARAFVPGESEARWSVNHRDRNGANNAYTNLEWASSDEQQEHKTKTTVAK